MKRRGFFQSLAGIAAGSAVVKAADPVEATRGTPQCCFIVDGRDLTHLVAELKVDRRHSGETMDVVLSLASFRDAEWNREDRLDYRLLLDLLKPDAHKTVDFQIEYQSSTVFSGWARASEFVLMPGGLLQIKFRSVPTPPKANIKINISQFTSTADEMVKVLRS